MLYLPNSKMHPNKFVHCEVPTKREIFARTGGAAVNPSGIYTGDDPVHMSKMPTESAMEFSLAAENYVEDLPKE